MTPLPILMAGYLPRRVMQKPLMLLLVVLCFLQTNLFGQDREFGIGVIIGNPTGLSMKLWLDSQKALDGAAAWSFRGNDAMILQLDYLHHNLNALSTKSTKIPVFIGIGGRITFEEKFRDEHDNRFGIRIPLGLTWLAKEIPMDVQFVIAPILDLVPDTELDFGGGICLRYYIK